MKSGFAWYPTMFLFLAGVAAQAAEPPRVEKIVSAAVESFEPLWTPPRGGLEGWKVGIDPAGGGAAPSDARQRDDLSLLTAAHLRHFVLRAGGSPVLTRMDNTRGAAPDRAAPGQRFQIIHQAHADLCISIRYDHTIDGVAVQCAANPRPDSAALADALHAALEVAGGAPDAGELGDAGLAHCEVRFGCAPGSEVVDLAARKICFENARRLFAGIKRYCESATKRDGSGAGPEPVPDEPDSDDDARPAGVGRSIWPEGPLPAERLDWFCDRFARESITNRTLVIFEVSAHRGQDGVVLRGRTNAPPIVNGLRRALREVGVKQIRIELQELPNRDRLGEQLFGVCRAPMALTYTQPESRGGLQTQLLFGEPLFLLDRDGDYCLLHAGDGYWGWVHADAVEPMNAERFDAYTAHPRGVVSRDLESGDVRIPRGATIPVVRTDADGRTILLPDGKTLTVSADALTMCEAEEDTVARIEAALDLLYVPYVFGGCSPLGLDCSGMVANVSARAGSKPSRDAWQQALSGWLVATPWHRANIRAGDQLFFLNQSGKISHTGVALGAQYFIHSAPPCVQIASFDRQDPLYDAYRDRTFFIAKRP